jgi:DNA-binding NarL/FixJ family response regulator
MHLLIIDDDNISSFLNVRVAQTSGIFRSIESVHNGQDALDYFKKVSNGEAICPDVILVDLNMPLISGFQFIESFRRLKLPKSNISILVLTSSEDAADVKRAALLEVDGYLLKPLTVNTLHSAIYAARKVGIKK